MLFVHKVFDILLQWVMKLGLIVCFLLFNLKLDYVIYIYIYIYVCVWCVCVCVCVCIKFVKFEILFKLFCSRGEYVILWWFRCYELVLKQMDYEVLTMKVYVSWDFAFCISSVSNITLMSYEVEFNCLLLIIQFEVGLCDIYIYVCVCVCKVCEIWNFA